MLKMSPSGVRLVGLAAAAALLIVVNVAVVSKLAVFSPCETPDTNVEAASAAGLHPLYPLVLAGNATLPQPDNLDHVYLSERVNALMDWLPTGTTRRKFWVETKNDVNSEGHRYYRRTLLAAGWTEAVSRTDPDIVFVFVTRGRSTWAKRFSPKLFHDGRNLINHSPGDRVIFNKEPFLLQIKKYAEKYDCDYAQMHPLTYRLHVVDDCVEVFNMYLEGDRDDRSQNRWFTKILEGTFGIGIHLTSLDGLIDKYSRVLAPIRDDPDNMNDEELEKICTTLGKRYLKSGRLLQSAVISPYLVEGRKFDLRVYVLLASFEPWYVYYHSGILRRSVAKFDPKNTDERIHLTNSHFQMALGAVDQRMWHMEPTFREYFTREHGAARYHEIFVVRMKKLLLNMFHTFKDRLNRKRGYWNLLGVDVIVDSDFNLIILEANTNPSITYEVEKTGLMRVQGLHRLTSETINLVHEIWEKTDPKNEVDYDPLHMTSVQNFEPLYIADPKLSQPWLFDDAKCFDQGKSTPKSRRKRKSKH